MTYVVGIRQAYISKHKKEEEKQAILLMTKFGELWHYMTVTRLSALFNNITLNDNRDFYCLNEFISIFYCLHSFRAKECNKRTCNSHEKA